MFLQDIIDKVIVKMLSVGELPAKYGINFLF
jgi:hypothetical protein